MVRKGCQKSCEEVEKDGTAGRVGKGHHNAKCQHEMLDNPEVTTQQSSEVELAAELRRLAANACSSTA